MPLAYLFSDIDGNVDGTVDLRSSPAHIIMTIVSKI